MRKMFVTFMAFGLGSCVTHVENLHPTFSEVGTGRITAVDRVTGETGESASDRYAMGFVVGGVPGALVVGNAEKDIGRATLFSYALRLADGSTLTVRSFSAVAVNDCVKVTRVSTRPETLLERLDNPNLCETGKSN